MAGPTSQFSDWILEGARLQDSSERVSFGAASFQPHLVHAERCAPRWDAGCGAPQSAVLPPLAGHASSRKQWSHRLGQAVVQAAWREPPLARLPPAPATPALPEAFQPGAQKPLPPSPQKRGVRGVSSVLLSHPATVAGASKICLE